MIKTAFLLIFLPLLTKQCQPIPNMAAYGFQYASSPVESTEPYCKDVWADSQCCLSEPASFKTIAETYFSTRNTYRLMVFEMITTYFKTLTAQIKVKKEEIFTEENKLLLPVDEDDLIFRFERTYKFCYDDINILLLQSFCLLTSASAEDYYDGNTKKLVLSEDMIYRILKNCFYASRIYCLFIKYAIFEFMKIPELVGLAEFMSLKANLFCTNVINECSENYSSKECSDAYKVGLVENLIYMEGITSDPFIYFAIKALFENEITAIDTSAQSTVIGFSVSENGYEFGDDLGGIEYEINTGKVLTVLSVLSILICYNNF